MQVIIYDAVTRQVRRQFTRFKDKAYCGTFRSDSKLLVAGGEDGIVQVVLWLWHLSTSHLHSCNTCLLFSALASN